MSNIKIALINLGGPEEMGPEQAAFRKEVTSALDKSLKNIKEIAFTGRVNAQTGKIEITFDSQADDRAMMIVALMVSGRLTREISKLWERELTWDEKRRQEAFRIISARAFDLEDKFYKHENSKI